MNKLEWPLPALALLAAMTVSAPLAAQGKCSDGAAINGACVDERLGRFTRERAIETVQSRLSGSAPLLLPNDESGSGVSGHKGSGGGNSGSGGGGDSSSGGGDANESGRQGRGRGR